MTATNGEGRPPRTGPAERPPGKVNESENDSTSDLLTVDQHQLLVLQAELDAVLADCREVAR